MSTLFLTNDQIPDFAQPDRSGQTGTVFEGAGFNGKHGLRKLQAPDKSAVLECPGTDMHKTGAKCECPSMELPVTVYRHSGLLLTDERPIVNRFTRIGYDQVACKVAVKESQIADFLQMIRKVQRTGQIITVFKGFLTDLQKRIRKFERGAFGSRKCKSAYLCNAFSYNDFFYPAVVVPPRNAINKT